MKATEAESKIPDITNLGTESAFNKKVKKIENKITDTATFINSFEFNRLTKTNFDARMKEATKKLASKSEVKNALDLGDKNREKIQKGHTFHSRSYFA